MVHSIHVSRHTVYWVQAQVEFGRVYFPGPTVWGLEPISCAGRNQFCACLAALAPGLMTGWPALTQASHWWKICPILWNQYCNYVLIWGDWLSCDPLRGSYDSQSPHIRKHLCPILWQLWFICHKFIHTLLWYLLHYSTTKKKCKLSTWHISNSLRRIIQYLWYHVILITSEIIYSICIIPWILGSLSNSQTCWINFAWVICYRKSLDTK